MKNKKQLINGKLYFTLPKVGRWLRTIRHVSPVQLVQRLDYWVRTFYYRSIFYPFVEYDTEVPDAPIHTAPDLWSGNVEHGNAIMKHTFSFVSRTINMGAAMQWTPQGASKQWLYELHSFEWLADLRATHNQEAKTAARDIISDWIDVCGTFNPNRWHPYPLSCRLTHWLTHSGWLLDGADIGWREKFMRNLIRQANHLPKVIEWDMGGHWLIKNLKAQIFTSLCLPSRQSAFLEAEALLKQQIQIQILPDGMHHERSPYYHAQVLKDLLDIHAMIIKAGQTPAELIGDTIDRMSVALAFFRHPDGGLALFNDGDIGDIDLLDDIQERCGLAENIPAELPYAGYIRLDNGHMTFLFDAGLCAPVEGTHHAHADTLSFELSYEGQRLFVNSGTGNFQDSTRNTMRGTAAHNTVSVGEQNSAEVWGDGLLGRRPNKIKSQVRQEAGIGIGVEASHDGYRHLGIKHTRRVFMNADGTDLRGEDNLELRKKKELPIQGHFHLHPAIKYKLINNTEAELTLPDNTVLSFRIKGGQLLDISSEYSPCFGQMVTTNKLVIRGAWQKGKCVLNWGLRVKK